MWIPSVTLIRWITSSYCYSKSIVTHYTRADATLFWWMHYSLWWMSPDAYHHLLRDMLTCPFPYVACYSACYRVLCRNKLFSTDEASWVRLFFFRWAHIISSYPGGLLSYRYPNTILLLISDLMFLSYATVSLCYSFILTVTRFPILNITFSLLLLFFIVVTQTYQNQRILYVTLWLLTTT